VGDGKIVREQGVGEDEDGEGGERGGGEDGAAGGDQRPRRADTVPVDRGDDRER